MESAAGALIMGAKEEQPCLDLGPERHCGAGLIPNQPSCSGGLPLLRLLLRRGALTGLQVSKGAWGLRGTYWRSATLMPHNSARAATGQWRRVSSHGSPEVPFAAWPKAVKTAALPCILSRSVSAAHPRTVPLTAAYICSV